MPDLKIQTIKGENGNEVSFCAERGGMITSIKLQGSEILYFDEKTFLNIDEKVRGGVPILFPNAGALEKNNIYPNLERHGFARDLKWEVETREDGFTETLLSNEKTREVYPYDFSFQNIGQFEKDGSFTYKQIIENNEEEKDMPISMGLHPYFKIPNIQKGYIKFVFDGGKEIEDNIEVWNNGGTFYIDNPKLKDSEAYVKIEIPSLGILVLDVSIEYEKIWVWSMPGKDFICIEPMMKGLNGLIDDPYYIKPKKVLNMSVNFKLILNY